MSARQAWPPGSGAWELDDGHGCATCGRPPVGRFPDGSPRYDHGHLPDGGVWEAEEDASGPVRERALPGIVRYAIVALRRGDPAPVEGSPFLRRWRGTEPRHGGCPGRSGRAWGEVRCCPACRAEHAVGTTCGSADLRTHAIHAFGGLLAPEGGGREGHVGKVHASPEPRARSETVMDGKEATDE
jgi:hypothetical protein